MSCHLDLTVEVSVVAFLGLLQLHLLLSLSTECQEGIAHDCSDAIIDRIRPTLRLVIGQCHDVTMTNILKLSHVLCLNATGSKA